MLRSAATTLPTNGAVSRSGSPPGGSTLTTSAPRSASARPAKAPRRSVSSTTRSALSGPFIPRQSLTTERLFEYAAADARASDRPAVPGRRDGVPLQALHRRDHRPLPRGVEGAEADLGTARR